MPSLQTRVSRARGLSIIGQFAILAEKALIFWQKVMSKLPRSLSFFNRADQKTTILHALGDSVTHVAATVERL